MLEKNSKPMFFTLLIPFYCLILFCLIGMNIGKVDWFSATVSALSMIIAAWGMSRYNSIILNIVGLILFIAIGASVIYSPFRQTIRYGPWKSCIYIGAAIILLGLIAFIFDIIYIKNKRR